MEHPAPELEQIARNELRFRELNGRIAATVTQGRRQGPLGYVCECGDADCQRLVDLSQSEYDAVREEPRRFFVVPGHELPRAEAVVDRVEGRYVVVEKPRDVMRALGTDDA